MTEKRYSKFQSEITGLFCIADENHKETFCGMDDEYNCMRIVNILNQKEERIKELENKNERCKLAYNQLASHVDANFNEYMTRKKLNERIRELENELELYKHYVEFVPIGDGDME